MSQTSPAPTKAQLARHWGVSPPYVTKLAKMKGMPEFKSLEEADAWRAVNAPPNQSKPATKAQDAEKNRRVSSLPPPQKEKESAMAERIDVTAFITREKDFDVLMIEHAEQVPQVAHGLYLRACQGGNPAEISAATKNWHEAAKAAAAIRAEFLDLQERTRTLIQLDQVMDILGTELQAVRTGFMKLGERCANAANPAEPAIARGVIDVAVDRVFAQLDLISDRLEKELAS